MRLCKLLQCLYLLLLVYFFLSKLQIKSSYIFIENNPIKALIDIGFILNLLDFVELFTEILSVYTASGSGSGVAHVFFLLIFFLPSLVV